MNIKITKATVSGCIKAPASKSYAQRAIAAALLAEGETRLLNMGLCSDTRAALSVAESMGAKYTFEGEDICLINGCLRPVTSTINIGESGLSARMFTPIAALCCNPITITGEGSIAHRPMDTMIAPLRQLGVEVIDNDGLLPITIRGPIAGGNATVDGSVSSQFITGLLMALPLAMNETTFQVTNPTSIPYINMTLELLERFGIVVEHHDFKQFYVKGRQRYVPCEYSIEGDWSGASCMLVAGAVAGEITVSNLDPLSKQADTAIIDALSQAGAEIITTENSVTVRKPKRLRGFEFDASDCPDLFPALTALAANCEGESVIHGTDRLEHKESNRAVTLRDEFGKMGIGIDISEPNIMRISGGTPHNALIDSHNDHRIAMSAAVAALGGNGVVTIEGAESVGKSYPEFWNDLLKVTIY